MNFSSVKKLFGKKNKPTVQTDQPSSDDGSHHRLKNLEVFRPLPDEVIRHVDAIKSSFCEMSDRRTSSNYQQFVGKLNGFLGFIKENAVLREYVNVVYTKEQRSRYNLIVEELSQTFEELSSQMKIMLFLNNRNSCAADMMIEIDEISKNDETRKKQICADVESALARCTEYKWSILKTSTDKQLLENFLKEIVGQKKAIQSRLSQAVRFSDMLRTRRVAAAGNDDKCNKYQQTAVATVASEDARTETEDVHDDGAGDDEYDFDCSFGSSSFMVTMEQSPRTPAIVPSPIAAAGSAGQSVTPDSDNRPVNLSSDYLD